MKTMIVTALCLSTALLVPLDGLAGSRQEGRLQNTVVKKDNKCDAVMRAASPTILEAKLLEDKAKVNEAQGNSKAAQDYKKQAGQKWEKACAAVNVCPKEMIVNICDY